MDLETLWIPDNAIKKYINEANDQGRLDGLDGINRWIVIGKDGIRYVVSPESAKRYDKHLDTAEMSR